MPTFYEHNGTFFDADGLRAIKKREQEEKDAEILEESIEDQQNEDCADSEVISELSVESGDGELVEVELTRNEIKTILAEKGIDFKGNASTDSLKQLIEDIK